MRDQFALSAKKLLKLNITHLRDRGSASIFSSVISPCFAIPLRLETNQTENFINVNIIKIKSVKTLATKWAWCSKTYLYRSSLWQHKLMLRWLNTVLAVCELCASFAKSWQEKGCSSQAETWQVKNILIEDFDWQVKFDVFIVSMATWTIEYNLNISLLLSLHKIRSLDFPINLIINHYHLKLIWPNFNRRVFR